MKLVASLLLFVLAHGCGGHEPTSSEVDPEPAAGLKRLGWLVDRREDLERQLAELDQELDGADEQLRRKGDALAARYGTTTIWLLPKEVREADPEFRTFALEAGAVDARQKRRQQVARQIQLLDVECAELEDGLYRDHGWESDRRRAWRVVMEKPSGESKWNEMDRVEAEHGDPNPEWAFIDGSLGPPLDDHLGDVYRYWKRRDRLAQLEAENAELKARIARREDRPRPVGR